MGCENTGNIRTKKALIRKEKLSQRHDLSADECKKKSALICESFLGSSDYENADTILLYKAYNNEVDTDMIFYRAIKDKKTVAYPLSRIVDGEPDLTFFVINDQAQLKEGYKGIPEPSDAPGAKIFEGRADICIAPGVAFDRKCHRIGYGKAFYDRYIRINDPRMVIGFAYEIQMADDFDPEGSDMAVNKVITDRAVYVR